MTDFVKIFINDQTLFAVCRSAEKGENGSIFTKNGDRYIVNYEKLWKKPTVFLGSSFHHLNY